MSKRKLLLADDSVTIQKVVNLTFADEGIEVISVGDGDSAMEKLAEISPDLVMADVNMPGLNGYQVCEKIRQSESLHQTPVILLVGSFEPFDEVEAKRVGADDFLTKPFQSIRQLVNKVTALLDSKKSVVTENEPEATASSSYDDTLEMEKAEDEAIAEIPQTTQFDDSGLDDEMIQTSQMRSYALDESQKFETKETPPSEEDLAKTQPLTTQEIKDFEFAHSTEETVEEEVENEINLAETAEEIKDSAETEFEETVEKTEETEAVTENLADEVESVTEETTVADDPTEEAIEETIEAKTETEEDTIPLPEVASILHLDEVNPLELPPIEYDGESGGQEIELETESVAVAETEKSEPVSSELVEAIVQKVMEKLSDKAVKEVAWEVVPQIAELIVKKMAEEKLKD